MLPLEAAKPRTEDDSSPPYDIHIDRLPPKDNAALLEAIVTETNDLDQQLQNIPTHRVSHHHHDSSPIQSPLDDCSEQRDDKLQTDNTITTNLI